MKIYDTIGWLGTIAILTGYGLLALGVIDDDFRYHGLILCGSIGVAVICYKRKTWQPFILNICFTVFATIALFTSWG